MHIRDLERAQCRCCNKTGDMRWDAFKYPAQGILVGVRYCDDKTCTMFAVPQWVDYIQAGTGIINRAEVGSFQAYESG